jgi:hypothetical protein
MNVFSLLNPQPPEGGFRWRAFPDRKAPFRGLGVLLLALTSCTHQPDLQDFDLERWRSDRGGCRGLRRAQIEQLKALRQELKGTTANNFAKLFGKPDVNQLADRNQEYYVYFLEAGPHCQDITKSSRARTVAVRFSALGLATEVTFQRGEP